MFSCGLANGRSEPVIHPVISEAMHERFHIDGILAWRALVYMSLYADMRLWIRYNAKRSFNREGRTGR